MGDKKDNRSFEEKHPNLNLLLGLGIVVVCAYAGIRILKFLFTELTVLIEKVINTLGKLDAVIIVALITATVSIVSVLFTSVISKIIEYKNKRRDYLAQKREEPYADFVEMIYKVQQNSKNEGSYSEKQMIEDISKFSKKITLWGSKKVVKKWVKFRENGANPDVAADNIFLMEEIMNEMRRDLGLKRVAKGDLLAFFVNDIKEFMKNKK